MPIRQFHDHASLAARDDLDPARWRATWPVSGPARSWVGPHPSTGSRCRPGVWIIRHSRVPSRPFMHFDAFVQNHLVIVRLRCPDVETSRGIARLVIDHHRQLQRELVFVLIIGTDCPMPEPDARRQLARDQARLEPCCASTRTVILGGELRQTLARSLVTGFSMLPGRSRPQLDASIDEMLTALEHSVGTDPSWLRSRLINEGLICAREADWPLIPPSPTPTGEIIHK